MEKVRAQKVERFGLDLNFSLSVLLNREDALSAMLRHCGYDVAKLIKNLSDFAQCCEIRVAVSQHWLDVATL